MSSELNEIVLIAPKRHLGESPLKVVWQEILQESLAHDYHASLLRNMAPEKLLTLHELLIRFLQEDNGKSP